MFSPCLVLRNIHNDSVYMFASSMGDRGSRWLIPNLSPHLISNSFPSFLLSQNLCYLVFLFQITESTHFPLFHTLFFMKFQLCLPGEKLTSSKCTFQKVERAGEGRGVRDRCMATGRPRAPVGGGLPKRALAPVQLEGSLRSCRYSPLTPPFSNIPFPEHVFVDFHPINTV